MSYTWCESYSVFFNERVWNAPLCLSVKTLVSTILHLPLQIRPVLTCQAVSKEKGENNKNRVEQTQPGLLKDYLVLLPAFVWQKAHDAGGERGCIQRLQPDFAWTFKNTQKQSFSTKKDICKALHGFNVVFDIRFEESNVARVYLQTLPRL